MAGMHRTGPIRAEDAFVLEVKRVLEEEERTDRVLRSVVLGTRGSRAERFIPIDPNALVLQRELRSSSLRHGLRLLPAGHYHGAIPSSAIAALRSMERQVGRPLNGFHILAGARAMKGRGGPAELLVRMVGGSYYRISRWGGRWQWYHAVLAWPLRHPLNLALMVLLGSTSLALTLPSDLVNTAPPAYWLTPARLLVLFWATMVGFAGAAYWWFAAPRQFGKYQWEADALSARAEAR